MSLFKGRLGELYAWNGVFTNALAEACTENYGSDPTKAQITDTTKQLLSPNEVQTFSSSNGKNVIAIDYLNGVATFDGDVSSAIVTADSINYIDDSDIELIGNIYGWKLDSSMEILDGTSLGATFKSKITGLGDFKGSADAFWLNDDWFIKFIAGSVYYMKFIIDSIGGPGARVGFHGFVIISGLSQNTPVGELVKETLTLEGYANLAYSDVM